MTDLKIEELINTIKSVSPEKAIDLSEGLELLKEAVEDLMDDINFQVSEAYSKREFNVVKHFTEIGESVNTYENKIEQLIDLLEVESEENKLESKGKSPYDLNYSDYIVDEKVEHSLYEDFTHKRPFGFRLGEQKIIEASTWQAILLKTIEVLMAIDEEKFTEFEGDPTMNGRKRPYFSTKNSLMRKPKLINEKIYVETNINANSVRNLLVKLLKKYDYRTNDFKVYLRADYTDRYN